MRVSTVYGGNEHSPDTVWRIYPLRCRINHIGHCRRRDSLPAALVCLCTAAVIEKIQRRAHPTRVRLCVPAGRFASPTARTTANFTTASLFPVTRQRCLRRPLSCQRSLRPRISRSQRRILRIRTRRSSDPTPGGLPARNGRRFRLFWDDNVRLRLDDS
jgi:hypothetical protein